MNLSLGLREGRNGHEFLPEILSYELTQGVYAPKTHLVTGANIEFLDDKGKALFKEPIAHPLTFVAAASLEILKNGNLDQVRELKKHLSLLKFRAQVPYDPRIEKVRVTIEAPELPIKISQEVRLKTLTQYSSAHLVEEIKSAASTEAIYKTGNPHNRLNIIILGDGYRQDELSIFKDQAEKFKQKLLETSPYFEYSKFINIWRVDIASKESGAGCDDDRPFSRQNFFGSVFPVACINSMFGTHFSDRFIIQNNSDRVYAAADLVKENGKAVPSEIFVLVNSPKYGGAAIFWASQSTSAPLSTFPHEFGHSFGGLGDEYTLPGDFCYFYNIFLPNISKKKKSASSVKWSQWIEKGTPIPTSAWSEYSKDVGLFQGASNCSFLYRPEKTCRMKDSEVENFCKICREQLVLRLYDYARPIDGKIQVRRSMPRSISRMEMRQEIMIGTRQNMVNGDLFEFSVHVLKQELETHWYVDGKEVLFSPTYQDLKMSLSKGPHKVGLTVQDKTSFVRKEKCHMFESRVVEVQ